MKKKDITIKDLAELLLPKLWIVAIVSILASAFVFVYSSFAKEDTYTSYSELYVYSKTTSDKEVTTGDNMSVAQGLVEIYQIMLESEEFLKEVVGELTDNPEYAEYKSITNGITINAIKNMMTVSQRDETSVFSISITATSPKLACVLLNAVYDKAIVKIPDLVPNTFDLETFKKPTDPADSKSIAPNSKHELRNAVLAFLIAAVVSVVAIWVYSFFDVVIRDRKKLVDNVDIPILGVIPRHELPVTQKGEGADA